MREYALPDGFSLTNHALEYGYEHFEIMRGDEKLGVVHWHGKYIVNAFIDTDQSEKAQLCIGYMDPQDCIYAVADLFSEGSLCLPAKIQEYGKVGERYYHRWVKVTPWGVRALDGAGGFNLTGLVPPSRLVRGDYVATITKTSDGRWRAAWFDYSLTPMKIAASMQVLCTADTRQECVDNTIRLVEAELAEWRAKREASKPK